MFDKIGVFVSSETSALFQYHFTKCGLNQSIVVYTDQDSFFSSKHRQKIVCLQMPYPMDTVINTVIANYLHHADHILVLMSELHFRTVEVTQLNDYAKVSYFICGELNFELKSSRVHKFFDWFTTSVHFYRYVKPNLLGEQLSPYSVKEKYFDVLLGRKKYHRDLAYCKISPEHNIVSYFNQLECDFSNSQGWIWEQKDLVVENPVAYTVQQVLYHNHRMSLSQIIPLQVYNQSAYTLVAETNIDNHYSFYTEKTVKPILARRLFIVLSGQYALRNLRRIGFRTFDGIIDESYDEIEDSLERCRMALAQMDRLIACSQQQVLERIKPICEHNYNLMITTNWYEDYFKPAFVSYFNQ
jgi:hypothetical protein